MFGTFEKKPTNMALYVAVLGEFAPKMFYPHWFVRQNIIDNSEIENIPFATTNDYASIEFSYAKFEARKEFIVFETDQIGFLGQTMDLVNVVLSSLKNLPLKRVEAHVLTHFEVGIGRDFINNIAANTFWNDIAGETYDCSEVEIEIPSPNAPNNQKMIVSVGICPKDSKHIHLNIRNRRTYSKDSLIKDITANVSDDLKNLFNDSIHTINKIRNYEFS